MKLTIKNSHPNQIHNLSKIKLHPTQNNKKNSATSSQIIVRNNSRKKLTKPVNNYKRVNSKIQKGGGIKKVQTSVALLKLILYQVLLYTYSLAGTT